MPELCKKSCGREDTHWGHTPAQCQPRDAGWEDRGLSSGPRSVIQNGVQAQLCLSWLCLGPWIRSFTF